jgi:hypothetical protein
MTKTLHQKKGGYSVMKVQLLHEPELQFGAGKHVDIRFGLMNYGPLDIDSALSPRRIRIGIVGDAESIEGVREWLIKCRDGIEGKATNKGNLFPRFPGFSEDESCRSVLVFDPALEAIVSSVDVKKLAAITSPDEKVREAANLLFDELKRLDERRVSDVLVCALPTELLDAIDPSANDGTDDEEAKPQPSNVQQSRLDLRHLLKARAMELLQPLQLILPSTYDPSKRKRQRRRRDRLRVLQDEATRAWNFHVAIYYKAGGIPWRLIREPTALESCYVGVSFYVALDRKSVSTSIAQVFNERGLGVVVRGGNAVISKEDRAPHLNEEDAFTLIQQSLDRYKHEHKHLPARLVVHKSSAYSDDELKGFQNAVQSRGVDSCDLINIQDTNVRLFRRGKYPPLRGTFLSLDDRSHVLYSRGSVDFFSTYPGQYVPRSLGIDLCAVSQTPKFLAQEILALSKMNWNNTQFDGGLPITLRASKQVGKILKYVGDGQSIQPRYSYYM